MEDYLFIAIPNTVKLPTSSVSAVADGAVRFAGLDLAIIEDTSRMELQPHCTKPFNFIFNICQ